MTGKSHWLGLALLIALAGCDRAVVPTESEASKDLLVERVATKEVALRYADGSEFPAPADLARLRSLAAHGDIRPSDRVSIAVGGGAELAAARFAIVESELAGYGIFARQAAPAGLPGNRAIITTGRYLVTTPPCPNWSGNPVLDISNAHSSNLGCATTLGLAHVVASPADLVEGRPLGSADAIPATAAVQRYQQDKVVLPTSVSITGFAAAPNVQTPAATQP